MSELQDDIIRTLKREPALSAVKIAERLDSTARTIERNIKKLKEYGLIERVGSDFGGRWKVNE